MSNNYGEFLKKLREDRKLSIRKVSELSGMSNAYLSQIETGKRGIPALKTLTKLANAYGVSVNFLTQSMNYIQDKGLNDSPLSLDEKYINENYKKLSKTGKENFKSYLQFLLENDDKNRNIELENYLSNPISDLAQNILSRLEENNIYFEGHNIQEKELLNYLGYSFNQGFSEFDQFLDKSDQLGEKIDLKHFDKNGGFVKEDEKTLWISMSVPRRYRRFMTFKLIAHLLIPEHKDLYLVMAYKDKLFINASERVDKEAIEFALELVFPQKIFAEDVANAPISINAIERLADKYEAPVDLTALRYAKLNDREVAIVKVDNKGMIIDYDKSYKFKKDFSIGKKINTPVLKKEGYKVSDEEQILENVYYEEGEIIKDYREVQKLLFIYR